MDRVREKLTEEIASRDVGEFRETCGFIRQSHETPTDPCRYYYAVSIIYVYLWVCQRPRGQLSLEYLTGQEPRILES